MDKPVLNLDQLIVESFATLDTDPQTPAVIETGCLSGCGGGGVLIGDIVIGGGGGC